MNVPLLKCKSISMDFGITKALVDVDFNLERGKICGLIGENGSGKSTLASIIAGLLTPTGGKMTFKDEEWSPTSSLEASQKGVGIIVQETGTVPTISVAHNIYIGQESKFSKFGFMDMDKMNKEAEKVLEDIGASFIGADMLTMRLNMQDRKVVEIAKAYNNVPEIFIVDETTNVLSHNGREILFNLMHRLANEGKSVLVISHDIEEVMLHCDQITILKDGHLASTLEKADFDIDKIKSLMIGREFTGNYYRDDVNGYSDDIVLKADGITTITDITNVSLELHKGEILGIGGLSDCGMHSLGKALVGEERLAKGEVKMVQKNIVINNSETSVKNGIAYISKDRDRESLALDASIYDNIASTGFDVNKVFKFIFSAKKEKKYVQKQYDILKIKANSPHQIVRSLSGGNKQKVAFGKWFAKDSDIFIMDCPTRGIDIGVKQEVYRVINEMKNQGKSIIIISEELAELIGMCDRILVMKSGRVKKEFFRTDGMTEKEIINHMI